VIGQSIGPYQILAELGRGGMGEVYRARDARLERDVAIKVLGADFAKDADRVRRFTIEAQATGALNHPNILAAYDVGTHDGAPYLVAELLEGETLRERMDAGRLPLSKALELARQVASGLAAAHAKGITHRDIKPENLFVTTDGRAKILDFGLAKAAASAGATADEATRLNSATSAGVVMGTVGYMSPEQVRGEAADARSDIFSFGVVLYELLSGQRPFIGDTAVQTMNAILTEDPPEIVTTSRALPPALERVVRHCLEKKPDERFQSARDLAFALDALSSGSGNSSGSAAVAAVEASRARRRWSPAALVSLGVLTGLAIAATLMPSDSISGVASYSRFATEAESESGPVWSPDGSMIAFAKTTDGRTQVFVRSLDVDSPRQLTSGSGGARAFWWPDSSRIGYIGGGGFGIWAVNVVGGEPEQIQEGRFHSAVMSSDGTLAAWRVVAGEGATASTVVLASPATGEFQEYLPAPFKMDVDYNASSLSFSPDGATLLLSMWDSDVRPALWRLPMPAGRSEPARLVLPQLPLDVPPSVSWLPDNRRFVTAAEPPGAAESQLWLVDLRSGEAAQITAAPANFQSPSVSPDGARVVFTEGQVNIDIVEVPTDGSPMREVLATSASEEAGIWIRNTRRFLYDTRRSGRSEIRERDTTTGADRVVVTAAPGVTALGGAAPSPDGQYVVYTQLPNAGIWIMPLAGGPARGLTLPGGIEFGVTWSPDSRSIAVVRTEEGSSMLRVTRVSGSEAPTDHLFTGDWNGHPEWSPDGTTIALPLETGILLFALDGSTPPRTVTSLRIRSVQWSADSKSLFVPVLTASGAQLREVDIRTGTARPVAVLPSGVMFAASGTPGLRLSWNAEGTALLTTVLQRTNTDLWILDNFLPPPSRWQRWFGGRR
jgi:serine/threonine protein kinase